MTIERAPEIERMLRVAAREPLIAAGQRRRGPTMDRHEVEELVPHRDPFLFVDRIEHVDRDTTTIVCRYDLEQAAVLKGHFPNRPVWPGVLQVEAIGQAGLCLVRLLSEKTTGGEHPGFALTHILGAEFVRPITPDVHVEIVARALRDGLFIILVGQCIQRDEVCSAAAVRGISEEDLL